MNTLRKSYFSFYLVMLGIASLHAQDNKNIINPPPIIDYVPLPDSMRIYTTSEVQVQPYFPGDIKKYLADSIRYPAIARKKNIQGGVLVSFIVEKNGSTSDIAVVHSKDVNLNNEAKRVISTIKWIPGKQNGTPVRVRDSQMVIFRLK